MTAGFLSGPKFDQFDWHDLILKIFLFSLFFSPENSQDFNQGMRYGEYIVLAAHTYSKLNWHCRIALSQYNYRR